MLSQAGFHCYANFMNHAKQQKKQMKQHKFDPLQFALEDYDIRKKGDHVESYNKITGEALFEAYNETEAWEDLKEIFLQ